MTTKQIRQITAEKVMGWIPSIRATGFDIDAYKDPVGKWVGQYIHTWRPDEDRNQSRMVVEKALELIVNQTPEDGSLLTLYMRRAFRSVNPVLGEDYWFVASPRDECEAVLRALGLWEESNG